jgi:hypothetical protein
MKRTSTTETRRRAPFPPATQKLRHNSVPIRGNLVYTTDGYFGVVVKAGRITCEVLLGNGLRAEVEHARLTQLALRSGADSPTSFVELVDAWSGLNGERRTPGADDDMAVVRAVAADARAVARVRELVGGGTGLIAAINRAAGEMQAAEPRRPNPEPSLANDQ